MFRKVLDHSEIDFKKASNLEQKKINISSPTFWKIFKCLLFVCLFLLWLQWFLGIHSSPSTWPCNSYAIQSVQTKVLLEKSKKERLSIWSLFSLKESHHLASTMNPAFVLWLLLKLRRDEKEMKEYCFEAILSVGKRIYICWDFGLKMEQNLKLKKSRTPFLPEKILPYWRSRGKELSLRSPCICMVV